MAIVAVRSRSYAVQYLMCFAVYVLALPSGFSVLLSCFLEKSISRTNSRLAILPRNLLYHRFSPTMANDTMWPCSAIDNFDLNLVMVSRVCIQHPSKVLLCVSMHKKLWPCSVVCRFWYVRHPSKVLLEITKVTF